jgi:drug/metabolite transporter (DMT)-like permease
VIVLVVPKIKVHSALFLVAVIYGANYSIAKIALPEYLQPFGFILLRILTATLLFWLFSLTHEQEKIKGWADYKLLIVCAIFGVGINMLAFFHGLTPSMRQ